MYIHVGLSSNQSPCYQNECHDAFRSSNCSKIPRVTMTAMMSNMVMMMLLMMVQLLMTTTIMMMTKMTSVMMINRLLRVMSFAVLSRWPYESLRPVSWTVGLRKFTQCLRSQQSEGIILITITFASNVWFPCRFGVRTVLLYPPTCRKRRLKGGGAW